RRSYGNATGDRSSAARPGDAPEARACLLTPSVPLGMRHNRSVAKVTMDDVCRLARSLPRTAEHLIRGRNQLRLGRIVFVAFARDGTIMGFAFPKEWRAGLVEAEPDKFQMPEPSDLRYNWICVRLDRIDKAEMRALVTEAWRMVVPRRVAEAHLRDDGSTGNEDVTS